MLIHFDWIGFHYGRFSRVYICWKLRAAARSFRIAVDVKSARNKCKWSCCWRSCYPLKGRTSVTLPRAGEVFAEMANLHFLALCAALLPSSLSSAVVRSINVRTTCSGLASEMRIVLRIRRVHFIPVLCRVAIKLNTESLTIYDSAKKSISQTNGCVLRVFGIRL